MNEISFQLEHIGINTEHDEAAEKLARLLSDLFDLKPRHGQKSEFAGSYFECMKGNGRGAHGHIAMGTPDLATAMKVLAAKGVSFDMDSAAYSQDGIIQNIYLAEEYGGFAIHILHKPE